METTTRPETEEIVAGRVLKAGNIRLDFEKRLLRVDCESVAVTYQEFELLGLLMEQPNTVISHSSLCISLWNSVGRPECKRLSVIVSRLRQKLGSEQPYAIQVVRGRGYGLLATEHVVR